MLTTTMNVTNIPLCAILHARARMTLQRKWVPSHTRNSAKL